MIGARASSLCGRGVLGSRCEGVIGTVRRGLGATATPILTREGDALLVHFHLKAVCAVTCEVYTAMYVAGWLEVEDVIGCTVNIYTSRLRLDHISPPASCILPLEGKQTCSSEKLPLSLCSHASHFATTDTHPNLRHTPRSRTLRASAQSLCYKLASPIIQACNRHRSQIEYATPAERERESGENFRVRILTRMLKSLGDIFRGTACVSE